MKTQNRNNEVEAAKGFTSPELGIADGNLGAVYGFITPHDVLITFRFDKTSNNERRV